MPFGNSAIACFVAAILIIGFSGSAIALEDRTLDPIVLVGDNDELLEKSLSNNRYIAPQCPSDLSGLTDGYDLFAHRVTKEFAAQLGFFATVDASSNSEYFIFQYAYYKDMRDEGLKIGRCGAGVQVAVQVRDFAGSINASLPFIAASATVGLAKVEYKMKTFGLSGPAIIASIPDASKIGKFDTDSYNELLNSVDDIKKAVATTADQNDSKVTVTPVLMAFDIPNDETAYAPDFAVVWAAKKVSERVDCAKAIKSFKGGNALTRQAISDFYRTVTGVCNKNKKPSATQSKIATDLLTKYGI